MRDEGGSSQGKYDHLQEGKRPTSFYGLPLKVEGRTQPIGVLKVESLRERPFTNEDRLLIEMMANVVATVIDITRQGETRIGKIIKQMGILSSPINNATHNLLKNFARTNDTGLMDQLAITVAFYLDKEPDKAETEIKLLFEANANSSIYSRIAAWAEDDWVRWIFSLFSDILTDKSKFETWEQVSDVAKPWLQLKLNADNPKAFYDAACQLASTVARYIPEMELKGRKEDASAAWFGAIMDIGQVLGEIGSIPLLFLRQGDLDEDNQARLQNFIREGLERPYSVLMLIIWNFNVSSEQIQQLRTRLRKDSVDLVVMTTSDIRRLIEAPAPKEKFRRLVLRQVTTISPFVWNGPVLGDMFFGREVEIKKLLTGIKTTNYAIVGNRKIGKTSLLIRLEELMRSSSESILPLRIDCQIASNYESFFRAFILQTGEKLLSETREGFEEAMIRISDEGKLPVLLMDEVEKLLDYDNNQEDKERLSDTWRSLAQRGICRFIFCGGATLARQLDNPGSVFFNFPESLPLGYLSPEAARSLLASPLELLGMSLEKKNEFLDKVLDLTSGHPNLIQYAGMELVKAADIQKRHIAIKEIENLRDATGFIDYYLERIWGDVGPLEKLITLLAPIDGFQMGEIEAALLDKGIKISNSSLDAALKILCVYSIFQKQQRKYTFVPHAFPEILRSTQEVGRLIDGEKNKLEKARQKSEPENEGN